MLLKSLDRALCQNVRRSVTRYTQLFRYLSSKAGSEGTTSFHQSKKTKLATGPSLEHFIANSGQTAAGEQLHGIQTRTVPYVNDDILHGNGRKVYFDVRGCQMNTSDTEVVWAILQDKGYKRTLDAMEADIVLVMTCAIREGAEQKIWKKLRYLSTLKRRQPLRKGGTRMKIGILGCMAERLKAQIIEQEKSVDVVCGPDAYRDLPRLLATTTDHQAAINVQLSLEETYADVMPVRLNDDAVTAFVSIMRGCDNMCSYCIVPFTRGRERSRPIDSILEEIRILSDQGVREVTLLGQNVNSYRDKSESVVYSVSSAGGDQSSQLSEGFSTIYKPRSGGHLFSELLDRVSLVDPEMRIRFTSPHPKDFPDEVLQLMSERPNICNQIHLPAQSGNSDVLEAMRRGYTVEAYMKLVEHIRNVIPDVALTSDFISGFCGETEAAHQDTLSLLRWVKYNMVFCYPYSMRKKTHAYHRLEDDVPTEVKNRRFQEVASVFREEAEKLNSQMIGQHHVVLLERRSKRSEMALFGRNDAGIGVVIPDVPVTQYGDTERNLQPGDYVLAQIVQSTSQTLHGLPVCLTTLTKGSSENCQHAVENRS